MAILNRFSAILLCCDSTHFLGFSLRIPGDSRPGTLGIVRFVRGSRFCAAKVEDIVHRQTTLLIVSVTPLCRPLAWLQFSDLFRGLRKEIICRGHRHPNLISLGLTPLLQGSKSPVSGKEASGSISPPPAKVAILCMASSSRERERAIGT